MNFTYPQKIYCFLNTRKLVSMNLNEFTVTNCPDNFRSKDLERYYERDFILKRFTTEFYFTKRDCKMGQFCCDISL